MENPSVPSILLVEDTPETVEMMKYYLRSIGKLEVALDGESAQRCMEANDYDLILMDINLGRGLTGLEITRKAREGGKHLYTPIIAVTAYAMKGDREVALAAGCDGYLPKPFTKAELLKLIKDVVPDLDVK